MNTRLTPRQWLSTLGIPLVLASSIVTSWSAPVFNAKAATACTDTSTWGVKTGSDPNAATINMNQTPTPITVNQLATKPLPVPINHRVGPTETTIYRTKGVLNAIAERLEAAI